MADFTGKYRIKAGGVLLIVLTGYAVLSLLVQSMRDLCRPAGKDPVTIHEARIAQLKGSLPPSGEVGYVTTVENDRIFATEKAFRNVEYLAQYALTQYTLAPLIVRNSPELPLCRQFSIEKAMKNVEYLAQYALTQYTLAPLIVRNSPELPLVVGNFLDGPPPPGFLDKNGLVPLKDFGDGLILYRREIGR